MEPLGWPCPGWVPSEGAAAVREQPVFWMACRKPDALLDPLTLDVPGLGEALAVFCFEEEAALYLGYGDKDLGLRPLGLDELMMLLLGSWSRFESVTLDPMPQRGAGVMLRLASMRRDDFLDYLLYRHGRERWACQGSRRDRIREGNLGYTRPDPGLVGGSSTAE